MQAMIFVLLWAYGAQAPSPDGVPSGDADRGQVLYDERGCYQCHNHDASGGPGPRLAPDPTPFGGFSRYVRAPSGVMPPYTVNVLSSEELADIYTFLLTIPEPPPLESIPLLNNE